MKTLAQKIRAWMHAHPDWSFAIAVVIVLRAWFAVWGAAVIIAHDTPIVPNPPTMYHGIARVPDTGAWLVLAPWQRWDAIWYLRIAEFGYAADDGSFSFNPLYPLLTRLAASVLANNYLLAALVVSTLSTLVAFVLLYRLTAELADASVARRAVIYWAIFPTSFYLFSAYAEPVLAACALACFYGMRHRRDGLAMWASAGATLARPIGFLIALPIVIEAWQAGQTWRDRARALLPLGGVIMAMGAWMGYAQIFFHDAFLWVNAEQAWERMFVMPGQTVLWTVQAILGGEGAVANNLVDFGTNAILVVAIIVAFRKLPLAFSAYALAMLLVPLLSYMQAGNYALTPMASAGRRAMVVAPAFIALAWVWRGKWRTPVWVSVSAVCQVLLFSVAVLWLWVD